MSFLHPSSSCLKSSPSGINQAIQIMDLDQRHDPLSRLALAQDITVFEYRCVVPKRSPLDLPSSSLAESQINTSAPSL